MINSKGINKIIIKDNYFINIEFFKFYIKIIFIIIYYYKLSLKNNEINF